MGQPPLYGYESTDNMEFGLDIKYDPKTVEQFNRALASYVNELGMNQKDVMRQWSGNLAVSLMMETPPFVSKSASNGQDARKKGIAAIEGDLKKAVCTTEQFFGGKNILNDDLKKILRSRDRRRLEGFLKKTGNEQWKVVDFHPDLHKKIRPTIFRKIKAHKNVTFNKQSWNAYLKQLEHRVGWMKAGWAVSAQALGKKVTNWIANLVPIANGAITQTETDNKLSIVMENYSPTIERYSGRFNYTINEMFKKMQKDIQIRLDYIARKRRGTL